MKMTHGCSIVYKTKLPMVLCFNKTDILSADFALEWMRDVEKFQVCTMRGALWACTCAGHDDCHLLNRLVLIVPSIIISDCFQEAIESEKTYLSSLTHSMSLVLDEFYQTLQGVAISAATGDGVEEFFVAVDAAAADYYEVPAGVQVSPCTD